MAKTEQPIKEADLDFEIQEGESVFDEKTRRFYIKGQEGEFVAETQPTEDTLARLHELGTIGHFGLVRPGKARMPDPTLTAGRHDPERTGDFARTQRRPEGSPAHDQDDITEQTSGLGAGRYVEQTKGGRETVRSNSAAAGRRAGGRGRKAESGEDSGK